MSPSSSAGSRPGPSRADIGKAGVLARALAELATTAAGKRQARGIALDLLSDQRSYSYFWVARDLLHALIRLDPTAGDVTAPGVRPTVSLLAAARRNSSPTEWLAALPALPALA